MSTLLAFFADPYRFSIFIIGCYSVNMVQFLWRGMMWDALYWFSAAIITVSVTFRPH